MWRQHLAAVILLAGGLGDAFAREAKVDFGRDVQPLFKAHCVECHGPKQQKNGFRLDRRRDAMRGGTNVMIGPGTSAGSKLYHRLTGDRYGPQMPPEAPLSAEEINVIRAWIDQGAHWPDELAGETPSPPPDPKATGMMEALRRGDRQAFEEMLREDRMTGGLRGPGGSTPLMYAALYGDVDSVRRLLEGGADPNARNEAGATALMWAVDDLGKTRLLLKAGADAKARSDDGRTPLLIATGRFGAGDVVKLLLDHGADPSTKAHGARGPTTPLRQAADVGDAAVLRALLERGADAKGAGVLPLVSAVAANSPECVDLLIKSADHRALKAALLSILPPRGRQHSFSETELVELLLDHGADVNAGDPAGRTPLMLAASSDGVPVETIKALIDRGADALAKSAGGETAMDYARWRGESPLVDLLIKAGAKDGRASAPPAAKPRPADSVRAAVGRSIPLLQRADVTFIQKAGCVSCHHNTLTAATVTMARKHGIPVDEGIARKQLGAIAAYTEVWRERMLQGVASAGEAATVSSVLFGLAAEGHAPDPATDAWARYLKNRQSVEGRWWSTSHRPPLEASDIHVTATSIRALQVYGLDARRGEYETAVRLAAGWLRRARPMTGEDRAFQLLGLGWAGGDKEFIREAASELLSEQRPDGGWAQLPTLASDAYATGQALVALKEAGAIAVTDPAYPEGHPVPPFYAVRRWFVVRPESFNTGPAPLRERLPARVRPVDIRGGDQLGHYGADPGGTVRRRHPASHLALAVYEGSEAARRSDGRASGMLVLLGVK